MSRRRVAVAELPPICIDYVRRHLHSEAAAAEGWKAGLASIDSRGMSSSRARAWLANVYAALGDERRAWASSPLGSSR